jgi:uncharacterized protein
MFLAQPLLLALAVAPLVAVGLWATRASRPALALLFLGLFALDTALTMLPIALQLHPAGVNWNWIGKLLSLGWALAFVRFGPLSVDEVGLTLRHRPGSVLPAVLLTVALVVATSFLVSSGRTDAETLAFQATMPGLAEELAYRGVFLALLVTAFGGRRGVIWAAVVTSVAFGLIHGLALDGWSVRFDAMALLFPSLGGLAFAWLRLRTGSLLFPVLAHNGANLAAYLAG